jgi:hypothetical protein
LNNHKQKHEILADDIDVVSKNKITEKENGSYKVTFHKKENTS